MNKLFKPGDILICIDDSYVTNMIKKGDICMFKCYNGVAGVEIEGLLPDRIFHKDRFKLLAAEPKAKELARILYA